MRHLRPLQTIFRWPETLTYSTTLSIVESRFRVMEYRQFHLCRFWARIYVGAAHAFISFACPKETNQRKRPPKTCPSPVARGSLRFSAQTGAAELAISDRSDSPRFSRSGPAMLGCVNGAGAHTLTPWCSRAPQAENGTARGLSDRAQRGSSAAPVFCRGAQGSRRVAPTKPWGAFSSGYSSLGKQRRVTLAR